MSRTRPPRPLLLLVVVAIGAFAVGGCGGDGEEPDGGESAATTTGEVGAAPSEEAEPEGETPGKANRAQGTEIKLASSPVGDALFDGDDQAIYLFDAEEGSTPECYGDCAEAWPPVLTKGKPVAEGPVEQSLLGTAKRDDGTTQVTYNGHPLYYYAHEEPGELRCHNVPGFGGLWLALDESGDALS